MPEAGRPREQVENHGRACTQFLFLRKAELTGWYLPPQKIPLAENRFLQASEGAENTKPGSALQSEKANARYPDFKR